MDATNLGKELIELHERPRRVAPFSARYPGLTADTGYAAARQLHAHRLAQGWKLAGRKIGFTNRTIWDRYGVHQPMWGAVYDRTLQMASPGTTAVSLTGLVQPRIEPEICFRLKARPPAPSHAKDPEALLDCIEWIAHSVEIVQCHHPDWKVTIADCTADNGLHGKLVIGTPVAVEKISGLAAALPFLKVALRKRGELIDQGIGANVLGSPLLALGFLIELLETQAEAPPLQAGEIVSTGTLTDAHAVAPGERWSTDFHGFAVRGLEIDFT
jgi:2-oxo-3-hexenedioate decarboxylase